MAGGGGGGGGGDVVRVLPRTQQPSKGGRRGHRQKAAWLPLDIIITEIAARSDPATFVRCVATCRDARRRIAEDPSLLSRLRLRDTDRFVLPLLHGHLTGIRTHVGGVWMSMRTDVYMVDTTGAADATRLVKATFTEADEKLRDAVPLDSRGGLVLVRNGTPRRQLLVCNLATRRCLVLPSEPAFPDNAGFPSSYVHYVLLAGGSNGEGVVAGAAATVGQPFQVLKAKLVSHSRTSTRMLVHTFSSEHGAWSTLKEILNPNLFEISIPSSRPLVVGDVVHWLCLTDSGSYVVMLHVRAARVNVTSLPASFPRDSNNHPYDEPRHQYLLATASAGGNPVVLVADTDKISAWEQSKHTKIWKPRPQVVIENETILGFKNDDLAELVEKGRGKWKFVPELSWFGERSGTVLLRIPGYCLLWLDLQSKKIVRCFFSQMYGAEMYCPYEVDLSSWVPTFSEVVTL